MMKAIYFDYHGVLDKRTFKSMIEIYAKHSYDPTTHVSFEAYAAEVLDAYGELGSEYASGAISADEFWARLGRESLHRVAVAEARQYILQVEPNVEVWNILPLLRQRFHLGILSDTPTEKASIIRKTYDLSRYFRSVFFSCDYSLTKRQHDFFRLMELRGKFKPEECLFIDDSLANTTEALMHGYSVLHFRSVRDLAPYTKIPV